MNIDIEKLRNELKSNIDKVIDSYISENDTIIEIPEEKIYMEFNINNQNYIAFTEDPPETEEMEMIFAKVNFIDGNKVIRNIETTEEYETVVNEFYRRLELVSD